MFALVFLAPVEMAPSNSSVKMAMEARKESGKEGVVKPSKQFRCVVKGPKKLEVETPNSGYWGRLIPLTLKRRQLMGLSILTAVVLRPGSKEFQRNRAVKFLRGHLSWLRN